MAATSKNQRLLYCFVAAVLITLLVVATLAYLRSRADRLAPLKSMATWQQADIPLGYPLESGQSAIFDSRFLQLTAFERAAIPFSNRMEQPMGSSHGALTYNAQPYWSDNKSRGGHHTGDDINGIGGMNTDLGDPVFSVANGLVIYRGEPSTGWGNTLLLAHRTAEGHIHQCMYAHLERSQVALGEIVSVGQQVGTVGTANLNYPAHLHIEMRRSTGVWIGSGYLAQPAEHLDPTAEILKKSPESPSQLHQAPLNIIKKERIQRARDEMMIIRSTSG